jgi:hypothetical protein
MVISIQPFRKIESHERDLIDRATSQLSRFMSVPIAASFAKSDAD